MVLEFENMCGYKCRQHEWFKLCRGSPRFKRVYKYAHVWEDSYELTTD